jgi:DUF438 domain-containing protein
MEDDHPLADFATQGPKAEAAQKKAKQEAKKEAAAAKRKAKQLADKAANDEFLHRHGVIKKPKKEKPEKPEYEERGVKYSGGSSGSTPCKK